MLIGHRPHLVVGPILHRMRHKDIRRIGAECLRLNRCRVDEFGGRNTNRGNAIGFEICEVMRTARRTGPSVGQPFDHDIDLTHDLLT